MPTAYTWQFTALDVYPTFEAVTNAVESMHWQLTADDGLGHQASAYGETKAGPVDLGNFIPFDELTLEVVQGWCEAQMGSEADEVKASLVGQIDEQISPITQTMVAPWL